ncbi:MAG: hypothetical protein FJ396_12620 [Verrucomicrobia bacterium]|nr:hypothetical protein [Verrucomicrobiota bacterium]
MKSNFPGNSTNHQCGIGFVIVDADLEWACRAWKALGSSLKKEETLALIPEENVLMDTEKRGFQSGNFLRVSERC